MLSMLPAESFTLQLSLVSPECVLSNVATAGAPTVDGYIGNETMWLVEQGTECLKGIGVVIS